MPSKAFGIFLLPVLSVFYCICKVEKRASEIKRKNPKALILKQYIPFTRLLRQLKIIQYFTSQTYDWTCIPKSFIYQNGKEQVAFFVVFKSVI
jgi:hypothetical protein